MRHISEAELRMQLEIQLKVLPRYVRTALQLRPEREVEIAVDRLIERLFRGWVVIAPDMVLATMHHVPGRFGVTEPWPFGLEPPPPPDPTLPLPLLEANGPADL